MAQQHATRPDMRRAPQGEQSTITRISPREGSALLEQQARKYLGMSGDEFRRQYRTGMLDTEEARVIRVSMVLPLAED